jgi:RNA polymerase sigma-70 factor (ECF subfamily)
MTTADPTPVDDPDALALRAAGGDREALGELIERCAPRLLARIRWMLGRDARRDAESGDFEDLVWTKILEDAAALTWTSEQQFLNLATRIARNTIVSHVRRPRVQRFDSFSTSWQVDDPADPNGTPSAAAARDDELGRMLDTLESLPPDDRLAIELRDFEGLSFREIAERMNRTENAVQLLHTRALARLGRRLRR